MLQVASGAARFQQRRGAVALSPLQHGTGSPARRSSSRSERKMPAPVTSRPRRAGTRCFGTQDLSRPQKGVAISEGGARAIRSDPFPLPSINTYKFEILSCRNVRRARPCACCPPARLRPPLARPSLSLCARRASSSVSFVMKDLRSSRLSLAARANTVSSVSVLFVAREALQLLSFRPRAVCTAGHPPAYVPA